MEGYPAHYVSHNLPFVILFGLGSTAPKPRDAIEDEYPLLQEKGIYISSDLPNVSGPAAEELLSCFHDFDAKDAAWNNRPGKGKMGTMGFTYRSVGRAFTVPAHKARPPSSMPSPLAEDSVQRRPSLTPVLHSPLSPLSPDSPLFPDGIMSSFWFSKHQWLLPSAVISFFNFSTDPNSSTLQDNKIKTEINALRTSITASSYRFRLVVVLVCEDGDNDPNPIERVSNIRRATSLDSKSCFYLPSRLSTIEIQAFVGTVLASIQPSCIEYYRDLSKHARRKRNRASVPPPTAPPTHGTSQTLSAQGWTVRYETKLGFFAESRQEMDAAGRNYEAAYEALLDVDVFETVASWSPRFDETRMLADVLAIRILRCLLWTGQTTSAVQSWSNHRAAIQDFVDRKGKGTGTYGWEAWEARWSTVMAELIEKVDVPIFHVPEQPSTLIPASLEIPDIYAIPEKAFAADERLPPWDLLHHEGYWLNRSAQRTRARRKLAMTMPKEDRSSPGQSPASQIASKSHLYDTYLCEEPHKEYGLPGHASFDHSALLVHTLGKAAGHFSKRHQNRAVERIQFETAREYMRSGRWEEAMVLVKPLWQKLSWRREGWWKLVEEMSWAVRACARHLGDGETLAAVEWELLSNSLTPRSNWQYNISKCFDGLDMEEKPLVVVDFDSTAPSLSAKFTFGSLRGRVGEPVQVQLTITSQIHAKAVPITLAGLSITFEGGFKPIEIMHDTTQSSAETSAKGSIMLCDVPLSENPSSAEVPISVTAGSNISGSLLGFTDLTFSSVTNKVLLMTMTPRDAGEVRAAKVILKLREEFFDLDVVIPFREQISRCDWWFTSQEGLFRKKLDPYQAYAIEIFPKPPKMQVVLPTLRKTYYSDETVEIDVLFINEEEEDADVRIEVQLLGTAGKPPTIYWIAAQDLETKPEALDQTTTLQEDQYAGRILGRLAPLETRAEKVKFQALPEMAEYTLQIKAAYHLASDPQTAILKTEIKDLVFIRPFDGNSEFIPHIHPDPWPSYFDVNDDESEDSAGIRAGGLKQKWSLTANLASFALERLQVHAVALKVLEVKYGATCQLLSNTEDIEGGTYLGPNETIDRKFALEVQKADLEDRRASVVRCQLEVIWGLESISPRRTTTVIPISQLTVPFGEPRVLACAQQSNVMVPLIHMAYTIENPSVHVLTFLLTMEASEDFAFSGPKSGTIQLVPLSRHTVQYNILPTRRGEWIRPNLRVLDTGFGKTLRLAAADGCKRDKNGLAVWVGLE